MMLGPDSTPFYCPHCQMEIQTDTKTKPGIVPIISGAFLAFIGCILGCCLIPCLIRDCLDVQHHCPICKTYLGRFKRFV